MADISKIQDFDGVEYDIKDVTARDQLNGTVSSITINGTTLTVTKADGTSEDLTTQDTTYGIATTDTAGLMSAEDKTNLDSLSTSGLPRYKIVSALGGMPEVTNWTYINSAASDDYCRILTINFWNPFHLFIREQRYLVSMYDPVQKAHARFIIYVKEESTSAYYFTSYTLTCISHDASWNKSVALGKRANTTSAYNLYLFVTGMLSTGLYYGVTCMDSGTAYSIDDIVECESGTVKFETDIYRIAMEYTFTDAESEAHTSIKSISASGTTITATRNDDSTETITLDTVDQSYVDTRISGISFTLTDTGLIHAELLEA